MSTVKPKTPKKKKTSNIVPAARTRTTKIVNYAGKEKLVYSVPPCVHHYLESSLDPFESSPGACLPCDLLPLSSQKLRIYAKGSFATGTTGFGYAVMIPSIVNDANMVDFTTNASVGAVGTPFSSYTLGSGALPTGCPYSTADIIAGNILGRVVDYGLRVRSTSSMMNKGGTYVTGESETHVGIGGFSFTSLSSYNYARRFGIPLTQDADSWDVSVVSSGPVILDELKYNVSAFGFTPAIVPDALIIAVNSAVPQSTFDFEASLDVEYIGTQVGKLKTRSHASPAGFAAVQESLKDIANDRGTIGTKDTPSVFQAFKEYFMAEGPQLLAIGTGAAKALMGDETGGVAQMVGGGLKLLADNFMPQVVPAQHRQLTDVQKSILAPHSPHVM